MTIEITTGTKGFFRKKKYWSVWIRCDRCYRGLYNFDDVREKPESYYEIDSIYCTLCTESIVKKVDALIYKDVKQLEDFKKRGFE